MKKQAVRLWAVTTLIIWLLQYPIISLASIHKSASVDLSIKSAVNYLHGHYYAKKFNGIMDWPAVALASAGENITGSRWSHQGRNGVSWRQDELRKSKGFPGDVTTDIARTTLAVCANGLNPRSFAGYNLVAMIKASQAKNGKFQDTVKGGTKLVNAHIWSIIALHAAGEKIPQANLARRWLISQQNPDGGFSYSVSNSQSDVDITANTLVALACLGEPNSSPVVRKGLNYLQKQQLKTGDFSSWGIANAESTAAVLQALVALKLDPCAPGWCKNQQNMIEALLEYQLQDGSFSHQQGGSSDLIATQQALLALADYQRGTTFFQHLGAQKSSPTSSKPKRLISRILAFLETQENSLVGQFAIKDPRHPYCCCNIAHC